MCDNNSQRRNNHGNSGVIHPKRSNRRRGSVGDSGKQQYDGGQIWSVLFQDHVSLRRCYIMFCLG